jgi:putative nucleotidyltransferase with HDIG domain
MATGRSPPQDIVAERFRRDAIAADPIAVSWGRGYPVLARRDLSRWLFWLVYAATLGLGLATLVILSRSFETQRLASWPALIVFFIFLVAADTKLSSPRHSGGRLMSSKSIVLSVIALFGAFPAAAMEALSALVRGLLLGHAGLRKSLFNAGMLAASAGVSGTVYHALPWSERFAGPAFFLPLTVALLAHSAVNNLLVTTIIGLDTRTPARSVYRRNFDRGPMRSLLDLPFAAMVILLYQQAGAWTLLLFLFPVLALYESDKLFQRNKEAHINSIAALTTALEADEPYTHGHSYRVAKYAVRIGRVLGLSDKELEILEYGGLLHDIGKIAITNDIICKPGRLTPSEFEVMKSHPSIGADIVEQISFLRDTTDLVRHHHERPDGKGYPHGLRQGEISLGCHILNVCDAFDAMTSDRPYRKALSVEKAVEELVRYRGTQFDERVVDAALKLYHAGEFDAIQEMAPPAPQPRELVG